MYLSYEKRCLVLFMLYSLRGQKENGLLITKMILIRWKYLKQGGLLKHDASISSINLWMGFASSMLKPLTWHLKGELRFLCGRALVATEHSSNDHLISEWTLQKHSSRLLFHTYSPSLPNLSPLKGRWSCPVDSASSTFPLNVIAQWMSGPILRSLVPFWHLFFQSWECLFIYTMIALRD